MTRVVDAVSLRHFGVVDQLSVLEQVLSPFSSPCWTESVRSEILAGFGNPDCNNVLRASFLGDPIQIPLQNMATVLKLQIQLGGGTHQPTAHLGEAESIFIAEQSNGAFITDDFAAYNFAQKRMGDNRVFDTVDLLREAVVSTFLSPSEAQQIADGIRNSGRHLRRGHPKTFTSSYFEPDH